MMLRKLILGSVLLPCLLGAQGTVKGPQADRSKAIDAAAMTPFFTKKGAESVKKVIAGGDARKADEKVLDSPDSKPGVLAPYVQSGKPGQPGQPGQGPQGGQAQPGSQTPQPEPTFNWRLMGISYGKRQGMALFAAEGHSLSVFEGSNLDPDTKVLSVSRRRVVVEFHGKRLELMPW